MLKTFRIGGIHPPENKLTAGSPVHIAEIPEQVSILLSQHIGAPAVPVVSKGDKVKVGTLIANSAGFVSARIHSSVSGTISKIDNVVDMSGFGRLAVLIQVEGDEWEESIDRSDDFVTNADLTSSEIIRKISDAGIVGLGGATFPTQVKLSPPPGMKANLLIINGAECEPYLTSDQALMLTKGKEILEGIRLLMIALDVESAVIGIENNKKDAICALSTWASSYDHIEVCPLQTKYPQGGEKQLIDAIAKRSVPSGALPIATGAVVQNVATAFAVYEAIHKNKPLIERIVTVTGKSLSTPSNFRTRIGTPVSWLIKEAGGVPENTGKIISGGPMMGKALTTIDVPTTKGCSGILLIDDHVAYRKEISPCIRCGRCVSVCPMGLSPYLLMNVSELKKWDKAEEEYITDCIECGSCSFTCPANRPLLDYIRIGKVKVGALVRARAAK